MAASPRWMAASEFDQLLLDIALDLVRPRRLLSAQDGDIQSLGDQLLADAGDGSQARPQGGDNLLVGTLPAAGVVGEQEDASVDQLRAVALPQETSCSSCARSSGVRDTQYLSMAVVLNLRCFLVLTIKNRIPRLPAK